MSLKPTDGELSILKVLWKHGPSTVRLVNEQLNLKKDVGYTTTLKLMQIMNEKGLLDRTKSGKTHIYRSLVTEESTQKQLLNRLLDTAFQGSAMKMVMQALGNRSSTKAELDEIRDFLDQLEQNDEKINHELDYRNHFPGIHGSIRVDVAPFSLAGTRSHVCLRISPGFH